MTAREIAARAVRELAISWRINLRSRLIDYPRTNQLCALGVLLASAPSETNIPLEYFVLVRKDRVSRCSPLTIKAHVVLRKAASRCNRSARASSVDAKSLARSSFARRCRPSLLYFLLRHGFEIGGLVYFRSVRCAGHQVLRKFYRTAHTSRVLRGT